MHLAGANCSVIVIIDGVAAEQTEDGQSSGEWNLDLQVE